MNSKVTLRPQELYTHAGFGRHFGVAMNFLKISTMAVSLLFIVGCSDPPPPQKTFADPLLKQKQRAADVQQTIDDSAQRNRDAVDKQERGDSSQ